MKRNNKKLLTIMLAGMLCAATAGTVAAIAPVDASAATAKTYALTSIFSSGNETSVANVVKAEGDKTKFVLSDGNSVTYNRNLAIHWFEAEDAEKYTNIGFKLEDTNFQSVSFTFNSLPMHATKDEKSVNVVKFINDAGTIKAKVIADGVDEVDVTATTTVSVNSDLTLSLGEGSEIGNYTVKIGETKIGEFTNVGAKYFRTSTDSDDKMTSLEVSAECEETKTTKVVLNAINGQSFALTNDKITDNAKPVMVVNEDVNEFLFKSPSRLRISLLECSAIKFATS